MRDFGAKKILREWLGIHPLAEENVFTTGLSSAARQERPVWDLQQVIEYSLTAWRENPIARRIVSIHTQYVIGRGIRFKAEQPAADAFLHAFWDHPLNRMNIRLQDWCDELCRAGNLFILISSDPAGMSYVRAVPAGQVKAIHARVNDIEQALSFEVCGMSDAGGTIANPLDRRTIPAADRLNPATEPVMLHFAINRPVGAQWGEPDLAPLLRWLSRYANWLEDRARLNRYRNSFLFIVKTRLSSEAQRIQRQRQLNALPPAPGSILVTGEQEEWSILSPKLESADANQDGLALKKMIAVGAGIPLHFLAEPESENKASAESAGGATYRHFEQRQQFFLWLVGEVLRQVLARKALVDRRMPAETALQLSGDNISAADNLALSDAAARAGELMLRLRAEGLAEDAEVLRIIYRFMGEGKTGKEQKANG